MKNKPNKLKYKQLGISTQKDNVVYLRQDSDVCISEGFEALTRVRVSTANTSIVADLNVVTSDILGLDEIGLSNKAADKLNLEDGDLLKVTHLEPIESLMHLRAKIYNQELDYEAYQSIITDIIKGEYSNIQVAAFVIACAGNRMSIHEISNLTKAMTCSGVQLKWNSEMVMDKHCIGGLPGNRTTPIVVSIVSAFGLTMPKTSSRAITSSAGTVDTMEVITNVSLSPEQIKNVVEKDGGCFVWGDAARLSPADDILIRVEKALDIDSEGQLIASVLSKKAAAGSTHVVIDMPVGETAKVRNMETARLLSSHIETVGQEIGLQMKVIITDGCQPVGNGIGPVLEAVDILKILRGEPEAAKDLKERAILIAGQLIELSGKVKLGEGSSIALEILDSGKAYQKFKAICLSQGRFTEPVLAKFSHEVYSEAEGTLIRIDNRKIAKLAKLSGAPEFNGAGILLNVHVGNTITKGQLLFTIYSGAEGELKYALGYLKKHTDILTIL
ncbi:thymidine phosphorylase family protein [Gramella sp. MT6]|uniref:thymidine phosphorylase family protein n=1 Tax=Gramella sp. MT6 TaxID=2705471 RepID=UPI001C5D6640|nr:thymidine phosphorylase family protein [Gramella sp. MT6]QYA26970.1 thymidine phosphorylase family protein [Gramella sp. MT6]